MGSSNTDVSTDLIVKAQQGDQEAFGDLVRYFHDRVINVVYRMCGDRYLAEEAAQIAFIKAWQHLSDFRLQTSFRNWLYRIAINTATDIIRKEKPDENLDDIQLISNQENGDTHVENEERRQQIRKVVLALPDASRAVIVLREYEGLSYREIAETLDISMGTVMSRLNYARNRLAEMLSGYLEET
ncbi:MAG: sigma-70 family RNA polymerase sigma factor [Anaerolineales bacterium]|nr:sigma-70 family RNA polymerase sigma factor [Anaerolineales bacterium]